MEELQGQVDGGVYPEFGRSRVGFGVGLDSGPISMEGQLGVWRCAYRSIERW